jgi:hypothetical protein
MDASPKWCLSHLFRVIEHVAESEQIDMLGFEFARAAKQLREGQKRAAEEAHARNPDLSKLHRSHKCKSGFVGVYANGNGYRAEGRDPQTRRGSIMLGSFKTAEDAALARYHHYRRHNLAYGELETLMERMLEREPHTREYSEERLKHEVIWTYGTLAGRPIQGLTDEERALEQIDPVYGTKVRPASELMRKPERKPAPVPEKPKPPLEVAPEPEPKPEP